MHKYGQYCPIAQAVEILGDRWTLLIVRDLLGGTQHFNDLMRGLPGISRALLADRLRRLQDHGIVEKRLTDEGRKTTSYHLTRAGEELEAVIQSLLTWGATWSFDDPDPDELDPLLLLWWMRDRVYTDRLPQDRIVVEFDFYGASEEYFWLVITPDDTSICVEPPGYDIDVVVRADLACFFQLWVGRISYHDALRAHRIEVDALPRLAKDFPNWFAWSPVAPAVRKAMSEQSDSPASVHRGSNPIHE